MNLFLETHNIHLALTHTHITLQSTLVRLLCCTKHAYGQRCLHYKVWSASLPNDIIITMNLKMTHRLQATTAKPNVTCMSTTTNYGRSFVWERKQSLWLLRLRCCGRGTQGWDGDAAAATWKHSAGTAYDSIFHGKSRHTKSTRRRDIDSDS